MLVLFAKTKEDSKTITTTTTKTKQNKVDPVVFELLVQAEMETPFDLPLNSLLRERHRFTFKIISKPCQKPKRNRRNPRELLGVEKGLGVVFLTIKCVPVLKKKITGHTSMHSITRQTLSESWAGLSHLEGGFIQCTITYGADTMVL